MRIKMLKTAAGPGGTFSLGQAADVDPDLAAEWVKCGAASYIDAPQPAIVRELAQEIEVAAVEPEEKAVLSYKPRRRK